MNDEPNLMNDEPNYTVQDIFVVPERQFEVQPAAKQ